ncbi:hypothetical protein BC828DRAFT_373831 [Blastocladiella britannica]|nr:hypothetical protein BC828DRAFT_373831 [Blastocladiella britannica]
MMTRMIMASMFPHFSLIYTKRLTACAVNHSGAQTFVPTNRIIVNHPLAGSPVVLASDPQSETTAAAAPVPALQHPNGPGSHQLMREWLLESEASANAMWYLRPPLIDSPSAQWVQLSSHEGKVEL